MNIQNTQKMSKVTQAWKYKELQTYLDSIGEAYEFEYTIFDTLYIYDLCLINRRVIVEFDGPEHFLNKVQRSIDEDKNLLAEEFGYDIERVEVKPNTIISADTIKPILEKYSKL